MDMAMTTEIRLKADVIQMIRTNQQLKNKLLLGLDMSHTTLYRHLDTNSDKLTTATALKIISEDLNISKEDLLTE